MELSSLSWMYTVWYLILSLLLKCLHAVCVCWGMTVQNIAHCSWALTTDLRLFTLWSFVLGILLARLRFATNDHWPLTCLNAWTTTLIQETEKEGLEDQMWSQQWILLSLKCRLALLKRRTPSCDAENKWWILKRSFNEMMCGIIYRVGSSESVFESMVWMSHSIRLHLFCRESLTGQNFLPVYNVPARAILAQIRHVATFLLLIASAVYSPFRIFVLHQHDLERRCTCVYMFFSLLFAVKGLLSDLYPCLSFSVPWPSYPIAFCFLGKYPLFSVCTQLKACCLPLVILIWPLLQSRDIATVSAQFTWLILALMSIHQTKGSLATNAANKTIKLSKMLFRFVSRLLFPPH